MGAFVDLTDKEFGRLKVIYRDYTRRDKTYWLCQCRCGKQKIVLGAHLKSYSIISCGCFRSEASAKRSSERGMTDISGEQFGFLKAIRPEGKDARGRTLWRCECACKRITHVLMSDLRGGRVKSCGCLSDNKDLTGREFGKLKVLQFSRTEYNENIWECQCSCANATIVYKTTNQLMSGKVKSCGCLVAEVAATAHTTHGMSDTRLYSIWHNMLSRCTNPDADVHGMYYHKGITVCKEWNDFETFMEWANQTGYSEMLSLDRVNPFKGYSPDNCRWITIGAQLRNTRDSYLRPAKYYLGLNLREVPAMFGSRIADFIYQKYNEDWWSGFFAKENWDALSEESLELMEIYLDYYTKAMVSLYIFGMCGYLAPSAFDHNIKRLLIEIRDQAMRTLIELQPVFDKNHWGLPDYTPEEMYDFLRGNKED